MGTPPQRRLTEDPLGYEVPLPLKAWYYPMGFPLIVETNSPPVLNTINEFWGSWPRSREKSREKARAVTLRVIVSREDAPLPVVAPVPCGQGHLISLIHGPENFAVCDVDSSFAFARLSRNVAEDPAYSRHHFLEPMIWLMMDAAHMVPLHSSCIAFDGRAVILCGDSGAGKTSLAYACARRGWSYLSDDATHVLREPEIITVAGRPFNIRFRESARELFPELNAFTPQRRLNGKLDIEVETTKLNLPIALEGPLTHVVFLNRQQGAGRATIDHYPEKQAARRLRPYVVYGDSRIRAEQDRTLDRLLTLPTHQLSFRDFSEAEGLLRTMVESGG
jgi:hypothetical protein